MKYLIYSDVHISQNSSIIKGQGEKFSTRLENIIKSLNWAEDLAVKNDCVAIFNLGDTFDKPIINSQEATAITEVKWSSLPHYVLVGNHDSNVASLEYSSVSILKDLGFKIITEPTYLLQSNTQFILLPYIVESSRDSLKTYVLDRTLKTVVLSHNDIAGINYGKIVSKIGFDIKDIEDNCDLFLNGHLHNQKWVTNKILNVGNLTGQNFSEDAFMYKHGCWILDTDTLEINFYENPYAFNFYSISELSDETPVDYSQFKGDTILKISTYKRLVDRITKKIEEHSNIKEYQFVFMNETEKSNSKESTKEITKLDYDEQFKNYMIKNSPDGLVEVMKKELYEVLK